jgi:hypothetical protein
VGNNAEATLARFYCALLDLVRVPSRPLLDGVVTLLAEATGADVVHVEITSGPRLRRTWSRTSHSEIVPEALVDTVLRQRIRAVSGSAICAPIMPGVPIGFVYLERDDGTGDAECEHVDRLAWQLGVYAERFDHAFVRHGLRDEVRLVERRRVIESVESNRGNLAATARELRVSRKLIYRISKAAKTNRR